MPPPWPSRLRPRLQHVADARPPENGARRKAVGKVGEAPRRKGVALGRGHRGEAGKGCAELPNLHKVNQPTVLGLTPGGRAWTQPIPPQPFPAGGCDPPLCGTCLILAGTWSLGYAGSERRRACALSRTGLRQVTGLYAALEPSVVQPLCKFRKMPTSGCVRNVSNARRDQIPY